MGELGDPQVEDRGTQTDQDPEQRLDLPVKHECAEKDHHEDGKLDHLEYLVDLLTSQEEQAVGEGAPETREGEDDDASRRVALGHAHAEADDVGHDHKWYQADACQLESEPPLHQRREDHTGDSKKRQQENDGVELTFGLCHDYALLRALVFSIQRTTLHYNQIIDLSNKKTAPKARFFI